MTFAQNIVREINIRNVQLSDIFLSTDNLLIDTEGKTYTETTIKDYIGEKLKNIEKNEILKTKNLIYVDDENGSVTSIKPIRIEMITSQAGETPQTTSKLSSSELNFEGREGDDWDTSKIINTSKIDANSFRFTQTDKTDSNNPLFKYTCMTPRSMEIRNGTSSRTLSFRGDSILQPPVTMDSSLNNEIHEASIVLDFGQNTEFGPEIKIHFCVTYTIGSDSNKVQSKACTMNINLGTRFEPSSVVGLKIPDQMTLLNSPDLLVRYCVKLPDSIDLNYTRMTNTLYLRMNQSFKLNYVLYQIN